MNHTKTIYIFIMKTFLIKHINDNQTRQLFILDLTDDHNSFGRGNVTYKFTEELLKEAHLSTTSKLHFQ